MQDKVQILRTLLEHYKDGEQQSLSYMRLSRLDLSYTR